MIVDELLHIMHDLGVTTVGRRGHFGEGIVTVAVWLRLGMENKRNRQQPLNR